MEFGRYDELFEEFKALEAAGEFEEPEKAFGGFEEHIKNKNLEQFMGPFYVKQGSWITLDSFISVLDEAMNDYGIPRKFGSGSISGSGLFSSETEAVFLKHPDHVSDYIGFAITVLHSGSTAVINIYAYGRSRQLGNQALANTRIMDGGGARAAAAGLLHGGSVGIGFAVGGAMAGVVKAGARAVKKGIGAIRLNNNSLSEEQAWYDLVATAISDALS